MKAYADSGWLCSLYAPDAHSRLAVARMARPSSVRYSTRFRAEIASTVPSPAISSDTLTCTPANLKVLIAYGTLMLCGCAPKPSSSVLLMISPSPSVASRLPSPSRSTST